MFNLFKQFLIPLSHPYVADLRGSASGKTILITAGMDGDEYAGIEAAYTIIQKYKDGNFNGRLIVIPIVNLAGFEAECSINPLDQKFPKYTFPGTPTGSKTEQLLHWLLTTYAKEADCWVDLHGGALTESVPTPFVWLYETSISSINTTLKDWYLNEDTPVVVEKARKGWPAEVLARQNCASVLTEAGGRGNQDGALQHGKWVESIMRHYALLPTIPTPTRINTPSTYHHVERVRAPYHGIFRPTHVGGDIHKDAPLGSYCNYNGSKEDVLRAPCDGVILWRKDTMAMRKGDTLVAIAH